MIKIDCHEKCEGCSRIESDDYGNRWCKTYINTYYWWEKRGGCPLCTTTHIMEGQKQEKKIGQQKSKKFKKIKR
jgi:hypothetical protein